ncbi:carboxypeptidase regulatory-like domain-containing protein [Lutibacter sp. B2]|nr:carboxypeptidase regulatory-like domain-containing protein [Lutibacter sp. B2]
MDKYILGQSHIGGITKDAPEVVLSLQLEKNTYYDNSLIYGHITDLCENPIENATVSFLNKDNEKIGSVYSSEEGLYTYFGVKYNNKVKIIVKKPGYKSTISDLLKICLKKFKYNVSLKELPISTKTLISGHLVDEDNIPLEGLFVYLLKICCSDNKWLYKTTISNQYGQFIFQNIPKGKYLILINNPIFDTYNKHIEIIKTDKIFAIDITLIKKEISTKITGQITDDTGKSIPNAIVVLYRVEEDKKLIPVKYTLCDEEGRYSFTNIPYNNYIVKAQ